MNLSPIAQPASAVNPCGANGVQTDPTTCTYTTAGSDTYTVPSGASNLHVVAVGGGGAPGGGSGALSGGPGGKGAVVTVDLPPSATTLTVTVAANGLYRSGGSIGGGGGGGTASSGVGGGGDGGGASEVDSGSTQIVVAGGGGGGGGQSSSSGGNGGSGGNAGGSGQGNGGNGSPYNTLGGAGDDGGSGSQTASAGTGSNDGVAGAPGTSGLGGSGGNGGTNGNGGGAGGGGGGGYVGGGGGGGGDGLGGGGGGGGGGSSFVTASSTSSSVGMDATGTPLISISYGAASTTTTTPASASVTVGQSITDSATVTGNSTDGSPTGTVGFFVCGPLTSAAGCATAGTAVGSAATLAAGANNAATATSSPFTPTATGTWCFRGEYSGDTVYRSSSDFSATECFTATSAPTTLTTTASSGVVVGGTVHDTATLSGGYNPAGTITFNLYGPNDSSCGNTPAFTSSPIPVSGDGDYGSGDFTTTTAGTYLWIAAYTGDGNNASASTTCGETNETVVVSAGFSTTASPGVTVGGAVSDTATLSGGDNPTGTITFNLYGPNDSSCANTPAFTSSAISVNGNGDYGSGDFTTTAAGTYSWKASYSGDTNNASVSTACGDAHESVTVSKASPGLTTTASASVIVGGTISDTAHVSGGFVPSGTLTFRLYGPSKPTCQGTPFSTVSVSVHGNGDYATSNIAAPVAGTYHWTASYGGDGNNATANTACGDPNESVVVTASPINYQVNPPDPGPVNPYTDNFPQNFQMEPSIARDPITGAFIAAAMDYSDEALCVQNGTGTIGSTTYDAGYCTSSYPYTGIDSVYLSQDAQSWRPITETDGAASASGPCTRNTHTLPGYCAAGLASGYDVQVAFGPKPKLSGPGFTWARGGRAYYSDLPFVLNSGYAGPAVAVSRSDDDGATWMAPVVLPNTTPHTILNDKDGLWVDANSSSPCFGDAYMAWDLSLDNGKTNQVAFSRSIDGGASWSPYITLLNQTTPLSPGPVIRSLPDGTVVLAWEDTTTQGTKVVGTMRDVALSGCGQTEGALISVANFTGVPGVLPGARFLLTDFPTMATDAAGDIFLSWITYNSTTHTTAVRFSKSTDKGQTWATAVTLSQSQRSDMFPAIAATPDGRQVVVAYQSVTVKSSTFGQGNALIQAMYVRSTNGGNNWVLHPLSPAPVDVDGSSDPTLALQRMGDYTSLIITSYKTQLFAYPIWTDSRNAVPCPLIDQYRAAVAAHQTVARPDPDVLSQCPTGFGNTDIYGAVIPLR